MIDYESLKKAVTPRELLERLSVEVTATGFALCPWHDDAKPSMKIYTDHVYCFSCNRYGDIIDLARAFTGSETHSEAARFIISEFNLGNDARRALSPRMSADLYKLRHLHAATKKTLKTVEYSALMHEAVALNVICRGLIPYSAEWVQMIQRRDIVGAELDMMQD